jgi:hypothetical protein
MRIVFPGPDGQLNSHPSGQSSPSKPSKPEAKPVKNLAVLPNTRRPSGWVVSSFEV